jgi:hypothetical protein
MLREPPHKVLGWAGPQIEQKMVIVFIETENGGDGGRMKDIVGWRKKDFGLLRFSCQVTQLAGAPYCLRAPFIEASKPNIQHNRFIHINNVINHKGISNSTFFVVSIR